jgi:hypothetical protein
MIPSVPPITVSRPLLFGLLAVGAVVAVAAPQPTSSFVLSFMKTPRPPDESHGPEESPR